MTANRYVGMLGGGNDLWTLNAPGSRVQIFVSRPELELYLAVRGMELSPAKPNPVFRLLRPAIEVYDVAPVDSRSS